MASTKTAVSFSLLLLAATAAVVHSAAAPFCDTADDKAFCGQLTKGATTWSEAMTNALNAAIEKIQAGKSVVQGVRPKLPAALEPQSIESMDSTCREAFENMIDNLQQCLGFVKKDPYSSMNTYLSATTFSDCTDGLKEFGVKLAPVDAFDAEVDKLASALLAIAQKKA